MNSTVKGATFWRR